MSTKTRRNTAAGGVRSSAMKILEPASEIFRYYEERINSKGRTCYRMSTETRRSGAAVVARDKSGSKILQPAEEIVRCYEERIYSLKGVKGAIQERIRSIESTSVNGPLHVRKDEVVEEHIVVPVGSEREHEHDIDGDHEKTVEVEVEVELQVESDVVCNGNSKNISPAGMDSLHKEIESVRVDRLDRRVSELEKENEMLRKERDLRLGDLRRLCTEVDQFLDVVESFLDEPCCSRGKGPVSHETGRRASSSSSVKNLTMTMKTLKSSTDKRKRPEPDRSRKPLKGSFYREKTPVASHVTSTASSSLKKMLMMGSRKRKRPDVERREVIVRKLVLPPGLLPWRP